MKKRAAIVLAVATSLMGFSLVIAAPGDSAPVRETPSGPPPANTIHYKMEEPPFPQSVDETPDIPQGTAGGYVFVPINPYRVIDSRDFVDGYLATGKEVYFYAINDQFGNQRLPVEAVAVTYNLTVTNTSGGGGFLGIFPADISWPGNSSINWSFDRTTVANGGTVAIGNYTGPGQVALYHGPIRNGGVDYILDVTGYYI